MDVVEIPDRTGPQPGRAARDPPRRPGVAVGPRPSPALARERRGGRGAGRACRCLAERVSLWHADLRRANLDTADLTGANLDHARLGDASLKGASLAHASLWQADLSGADLTAADLGRAKLDHAVLRSSVLRGTGLGGATLWGAHLEGTDLSEAIGLVPSQLEPTSRDGETRLPAASDGIVQAEQVSDVEDDPVVLDEHRGMMERRATEIRRQLTEVEAEQTALRRRQVELERFLFAAPSASWEEAAAKARYLLMLFADTSTGRDRAPPADHRRRT